MPDLVATAKAEGFQLQVTRLETADEAQRAPSVYGVFTVLHDGRVLADYYTSKTRFRNLLRGLR